jgi:hypothetical protein
MSRPKLYEKEKTMRTCLLAIFVVTCPAFATERVTATGKVVDADGKPVGHAAVVVYSAGVKKGFNLYCPTCYIDCGKRTFTAADGTYSIDGLNADLVFNLLVASEGYSTKFVNKVDPQKGPAEPAVLQKRVPPEDPAQIVRGKVVDSHGEAVPDALVEQQGAIFGDGGRSFGDRGWIDLIAVTNPQGDFELAHTKPLTAAIVKVSPRGMAGKLATVATGTGPKTITVTEGATIRGRLMQDGKPVAHAEIGLTSHSRNMNDFLPEARIGTDEEGRFELTNVTAGRIWYLYGKMESLAPRGLAADAILCATKDDGQVVNVGDIPVKPAFTLRGKVTLSDGKPIPPDMRVNIGADRGSDTQTAIIAPDGQFEFKGLVHGAYDLWASVKGYQARGSQQMEILIEGDGAHQELLLDPVASKKR